MSLSRATTVSRRAFQVGIRPWRNAPCRSLHRTAPASANKARDKFSFDDLFAEESEPSASGSVDGSTTAPDVQSQASSAAETQKKSSKSTRVSEARSERFQKLYSYAAPRMGKQRIRTKEQLRDSIFVNLIQLATCEEHMRMIIELFPKWRESERKVTPGTVEAFTRRCEELKCPLLALDVFGNAAKYGMGLTLPAARQLLHAFHAAYPIEHMMTVISLYSVHDLPPVTQDIVSLSLLLSACYRHSTTHTIRLAQALTPYLHGLTELKKVDVDPKVDLNDRGPVWARESVAKVHWGMAERRGKQIAWLDNWRIRNGFLDVPLDAEKVRQSAKRRATAQAPQQTPTDAAHLH